MLGDPLVAIVRETLMNPIVTPPSPAYLALRREIEAIGEVRGEVRGEAKALLVVLTSRGLDASEALRQRITACEDATQLQSWIARASVATTLDEVFGEASDAE